MTDPSSQSGHTWWTIGAQKGIYQPPYAVKWHGRWWRTHYMTAPTGEPRLSSDDIARIRALPQLPYGQRRVLDYLSRTNKHFRDLPLLDVSRLPAP